MHCGRARRLRCAWPGHVLIAILLAGAIAERRAAATEAVSRSAAASSIQADALYSHVRKLADDTFEGREAGSRGGRAAGLYIVELMRRAELAGGSTPKSYYQQFGANCSNLLGLLKGSDPQLSKQYIVASAHYDHVGYGTPRSSYGPIGYIHNGADDNASGVATLLEVIAAFARNQPPKRSILFAFWDGEEKGLLGSTYWLDHPTVPLSRVRQLVNLDMVGRMQGTRLSVYGTRTAAGLRRVVSLNNDELLINFTWELKNNSDHWPFYQRQIPILMMHTGLHSDYHRPSDDLEKINADGLQHVSRLLFRVLVDLADRPAIAQFRSASRSEHAAMRQSLERPLAPLAGRLGMSWNSGQADPILTRVAAGSPAARAGLRPGDRITEIDGRKLESLAQLRREALQASGELALSVERAGEEKPLAVSVTLDGQPIRVGLSWRSDDADAGAVIVTRVVPGSAADEAGLALGDRIYQLDGKDLEGTDRFAAMLREASGDVTMLVERSGKTRTVKVALPPLP